MTCDLLDIGCHFTASLAPLFHWWQTWDVLIALIVGLLIGGFLGWRIVLAVLTLGIGLFIYDRTRPRDTDPAYETGEEEPPPTPKRRKTLF